MNKGDIVYVSGMNTSDCSSDGAWDDKRLREAYDRATKIAQETVAKRVAMETNTSQPANSEVKRKLKKPVKWSTGKPCRAIYEEDGQEYEAVISDIIDETDCVVKFIGYDNHQVVSMASLMPSRGRAEIVKQIESVDRDVQHYFTDVLTDCADCSSEAPDKKKLHKSQSKSKKQKLPFPNFPESLIPNLSNMSAFQVPMTLPIPPPIIPQVDDDQEQQALSSMLLSWYLSGYYSGLYQGMKNNKSKRRH